MVKQIIFNAGQRRKGREREKENISLMETQLLSLGEKRVKKWVREQMEQVTVLDFAWMSLSSRPSQAGLTLYEDPKCAGWRGVWRDSTNAHRRFSLSYAQSQQTPWFTKSDAYEHVLHE